MLDDRVTPETNLTQPGPRPQVWRRIGNILSGNPVMVKELRGRMRGRRAFIVLSVYLLVLAVMLSLAYLVYLSSISTSPAALTNTRQLIGKVMFAAVVSMQLVCVTFIAPALTSGAISTEREHQTYDLLQTTLLPAQSLVLGKFFSALVFILLLLFTALPLQSLAFLFGGVAPEEVLIGLLLLVVTAINFCALGLFFSSFMKSTLGSTVLSYALPILGNFGLPLLLTVLSGFLGVFASNFTSANQLGPGVERALLLGGWFLLSTQPIATAVASEVLLLDQHSLWFYNQSLSNGASVTLISPWILYTLINLGVSLILLFFAISFARRKAR
jgi:ABC-2 type transport system permease protein